MLLNELYVKYNTIKPLNNIGKTMADFAPAHHRNF